MPQHRPRWPGLLAALVLLVPVAALLVAAAAPVPAVAAAAPATARALSDMDGHWARAAVQEAVQHGYVGGYPDGAFRPDQPVTRAEIVKMAQVALGRAPQAGALRPHDFPDLPAEHWLVQQGFAAPDLLRPIATLWGLRPGQPLGVSQPATRAEVAALAAYLGGSGAEPSAATVLETARFADLHAWNRTSKPWVGLAVAQGLITGFPDCTFRPEATATRAQAVVMLERARGGAAPAGTAPAACLTALATGWAHTLALRSDGSVWAAGNNGFAQLGDGTTESRLRPVRVAGLPATAAIAAGWAHSLALDRDGRVWTWGDNHDGQLGDGTTQSSLEPIRVADLDEIVAVAAGRKHSLALRRDGTIWAWGDSNLGQLGDGTREQGRSGNLIVLHRPLPGRVAGLSGVVAIAAALDQNFALKADGTVWAWGESRGSLGDGTRERRLSPVQVRGLTDVTAIAAGGDHGVALRQDGTVWAWGENVNQQLSAWDSAPRTEPIPVAGWDGPLTDVVAIAAGWEHTLALRADGTVQAWGLNGSGQLGDGTRDTRRPQPVPGLADAVLLAAGTNRSLALTAGGGLWAWGDNLYGALGAGDGAGATYLTPAALPLWR